MVFVLVATGAHSIPGGIFPAPPVASDLLTKMPPPTSFHVSLPWYPHCSTKLIKDMLYATTRSKTSDNVCVLTDCSYSVWRFTTNVIYSAAGQESCCGYRLLRVMVFMRKE